MTKFSRLIVPTIVLLIFVSVVMSWGNKKDTGEKGEIGEKGENGGNAGNGKRAATRKFSL